MNTGNAMGLRYRWLINGLFQLLAALVFGGLSFLSLNYAGQIERHVSPVWPASGLAMAILFFGGRRFWVAILLGSLASNGLTSWLAFPCLQPWAILLPSLGISVGAVLEALIAARLLETRASGRAFCLDSSSATAFVLAVALMPSAISALIGPLSLVLFGIFSPENLGTVAMTWFVGDATGILVFGAALVFPWRGIDWPNSKARRIEALLLLIVLVMVGGVMTGMYSETGMREWPLAYLVLPVVLWAVFRFNHSGTLVSLLLITLMSLGGASIGFEVFPSGIPGYALFFQQMFLLIVTSVAWTVCGRVNELQILNQRLEELVASKVLGQRKALQQREESLSVAAHDLQVPLVGIRNLVESLLAPRRKGELRESSRTLLAEVGAAAEQARALADRLLTRQDASHWESRPEAVDWVELIQGAARRSSLLVTSRDIRFVTKSEAERIEGSVDRVLLLQVLENLCHNAVKFSPRNGTITVGIHEEAENVVITLADEGPGFRADEIPVLFTQVGFRSRVRAPSKSTGLGLFIVGKAVRELGGTITCTSSEGQGATFTIRLPRCAV